MAAKPWHPFGVRPGKRWYYEPMLVRLPQGRILCSTHSHNGICESIDEGQNDVHG